MLRTLFILFALILCTQPVLAQDKKAFKQLQNARMAVSEEDLPKAWTYIQKALKIDPYYVDALVMAGDYWMSQENPKQAVPYYLQALSQKKLAYIKYKAAVAYRDNLQYAEALKLLEEYQQESAISKERKEEFDVFIASVAFAAEAIKKPVAFAPQDMGPTVNTTAMEYFPSIDARGEVLVFTSRKTTGDKQDEDFFETRNTDGQWQAAAKLEGFLNTNDNEGAQTLSADGKELYFAGCNREDGFGSCDIYVSYFRNNLWTKPRNLGPNVNTGSWDSQPSLSPDGSTLYFVRGKSGYTTQVNIWQSKRQRDGSWGRATLLPGLVNTNFAEESPYIHFDNQTLYFTSNGHPGFGRKDIFYSKKQPDGSWGTPVNLGYPINTPNNEFSLVVGPDGKTAYFASNRNKGGEDLDIFSFELPKESQATEIAWVLGTVNDEDGKAVITAVEFFDLITNQAFQTLYTDGKGEFFAVMPTNKSFAVFITKEGYLPYSENYDLTNVDKAKNYTVNITLEKLKKGSKFTLTNVLFDTDKAILKPESTEELNRLVAFLKANPTTKAELRGHTDNQGSSARNKVLSEERANAVMQYLKEEGIEAGRLTAKGFGDTAPIATNDTEVGRKQNRRTEVVLQ